jgi:hypothetical protein
MTSQHADPQAVEELTLYIVNTSQLYPERLSIYAALMRRRIQGKYNTSGAAKAFALLVEHGAQRFVKEFPEFRHVPWAKLFPPAVRRKVAAILVEAFEAEASLGNYDYLLGGRGQKNPRPGKARISKTDALATISHDAFLRGYFEAALWSSTDDNGEPLERNYTVDAFDAKSLEEQIIQCADFVDQPGVASAIESYALQAGRDFWLTRNRHGVGFWSDDWPSQVGTYLTTVAHAYGEVGIYTDGNKLHTS